MPQRFYLPGLTDTGTVTLDGAEAHHLIHVLRSKVGETVELFNGAGLVASAQIEIIGKRDAELRIQQSHRETLPSRQVILATAVPKGDRFDWLIEKATELGVTKVIPLLTARSVVDPRDSKLDKLRQTVVAACKQSGRNHLLELSAVMAWSTFCECEIACRTCFVAHPGSHQSAVGCEEHSQVTSHDRSVRNSNLASARPAFHPIDGAVVFAVGPEGGFTNVEVAMAVERGARLIDLGPYILRIETAALALAACAAVNPLDQ